MAEKSGVDNEKCIREAVCINADKIFDSCKDKDCVEDLRVYPTACSQGYIDEALNIRPKSAELLHVQVKVEPVSFKKGSYTVDCCYFYKLIGETFPGGELCQGLARFNKRVMLFGSEGNVKQYSSCGAVNRLNFCDMPVASVSAVDPIALSMRLSDGHNCEQGEKNAQIPEFIAGAFPDRLCTEDCKKRWYVTLGQFSIVMLQRPTQLLIPAYDYCLPDKECPGSSEDDPCELFGTIRFPVEEFFPPDEPRKCEDYRGLDQCK